MTKDARYGLAALLACLSAISLARSLDVPRPSPTGAVRPPSASSAASALRDGQPLDLNRANSVDLTLLPGIGPRVAERILEERTRLGGFRAPEQLLEVRGIGAKLLARVRPFVRVESEEVEGARATKLDFGRRVHGAVDEKHSQTDVDPKQPCTRRQVIETDGPKTVRRQR